jgi:hypothetical protein
MKLTYTSLEDVAQALVDVVSLIRDQDFAASDKRTAHLTRLEILVAGAVHRKSMCKDGSLSAQLMDYIASPDGSNKKPKLSIVKG